MRKQWRCFHCAATTEQGEIEALIGQELRLWSVEKRKQPVSVDPAGNTYEEWWVVLRNRTEHSHHDIKIKAREEMYDALARALSSLLRHVPAGGGGGK